MFWSFIQNWFDSEFSILFSRSIIYSGDKRRGAILDSPFSTSSVILALLFSMNLKISLSNTINPT